MSLASGHREVEYLESIPPRPEAATGPVGAAGMVSLDKALPLLTAGEEEGTETQSKQSSVESQESFKGTDLAQPTTAPMKSLPRHAIY